MNVNYFFLWNYNKFPFVYSMMRKNERNILVINTQDCNDLHSSLLELKKLNKITDVILFKNSTSEYLFNVLKRIFIYPFKKKNCGVNFYLDGFVGYYPLSLANIGRPDQIFFYEEGESTYSKDVLFEKATKPTLKDTLNTFIKKVLFVQRNSINDISGFYVRDKIRLERVFSAKEDFKYNFPIFEIDDIEAIKNLSHYDKSIIKKIFFQDLDCTFSSQNSKKAIILTQPTYFYGIHSKEELAALFNEQILKLKENGYEVYLKLHPREKEDIYIKDNVKRINGKFPFELLAIYDIVFDVGLTYNSTAINSSLIKDKILISKL
ncbi:polysialyltransferase family glycosyltransferase [Enterobacter wuhouensis]|uniref:polysialyltransferase family glycosyltransferase n=1 Tax=Enterobacter wuhouensis TaxID=2529381 RepID=UPI002FD62818